MESRGWRNNSVFPGVSEMLVQLHHEGFPLYVCTSKHEDFSVRILENFGLAHLFTSIRGDKAENGSHSKVDLLAGILGERSLSRDTAWMASDRIFDIEAAHANDIRCLAVAWGYGTPEEWSQADAQAATPADVFGLVSQQVSASGLAAG
ncbi:MAG: HAD hydrolase-like protein [Terracidiphilus sp.]